MLKTWGFCLKLNAKQILDCTAKNVNLPRVYQELNVLIPDEEELLPEEDNITKELQTIRDACTSIIGSLSRLDKILNN